MTRFNWRTARLAPVADVPSGFAVASAQIDGAISAQHLGGALYEIPPGQRLFPYHWEAGQEEWLLVLAGRPTVRTPDGDHELRPGDVTCFPVGPAGAHQVRNETVEAVRVIMVSERRRPNVVVYPDSGKVGARTDDLRHMSRLDDAAGYWDGET